MSAESKGKLQGGTNKASTLRIIINNNDSPPSMKGWLEKKRKFGWHKRFFVLERGLFSYYETEKTDSFPMGTMTLSYVVLCCGFHRVDWGGTIDGCADG